MYEKTLKPIRIIIEKHQTYPLTINEITYAFQTLLTIAGFPWEFADSDDHGQCDIYFGQRLPHPTYAKLHIRMSVIGKTTELNPIQHVKENACTFLYFHHSDSCSPIILTTSNHNVIQSDIILATFFLLSGQEEKYIKRDRWDLHHIQDSFLFQNRLLHTPIINAYGLLLREIFSPTHPFLPAWPGGKKYALALSHDIDYPEIRPIIETGRYILSNKRQWTFSKAQEILFKKEHFFKFEDWLRLETQYGVKSAFYFCGFRGSLFRYLAIAPDPFYDIRKKALQDVIRMIDDLGFEVGMHGSFFAYRSESQFRSEKEQVEAALGKNIYGNRHHYWHMNPICPSETAQIHEQIGLLYDSSIFFERHSGFRRSICSPYHLFLETIQQPLQIMQLPPTLMDDQLFGHAKHAGFESYQEHIRSLLQAVRTYEGVFTADYHGRVLNETFFPNWGKSYEFLLDQASADSACYCDTPVNIIKHWEQRENILRQTSLNEMLAA